MRTYTSWIFGIAAIILAAFAILPGCASKKIDNRWGFSRNVCKTLHGDVLVYVIFVDTKGGRWEEKEVNETLDSFRVAAEWLHAQAKENKVSLNVKVEHFSQSRTIIKNLPKKTLYESLTSPTAVTGVKKVNSWGDAVAKQAGLVIPNLFTNDSMPHVTTPKNKERLIAKLRDEYNTEHVALFMMLKVNKPEDNLTVSLNTMSSKDVEFAISSFRQPSIIAYEFLELFGAASLYTNPYVKKIRNREFARQEFPDDVMVAPNRPLQELKIEEFTRYTIGWSNELDPRYTKLLKEDRREAR